QVILCAQLTPSNRRAPSNQLSPSIQLTPSIMRVPASTQRVERPAIQASPPTYIQTRPLAQTCPPTSLAPPKREHRPRSGGCRVSFPNTKPSPIPRNCEAE